MVKISTDLRAWKYASLFTDPLFTFQSTCLCRPQPCTYSLLRLISVTKSSGPSASRSVSASLSPLRKNPPSSDTPNPAYQLWDLLHLLSDHRLVFESAIRYENSTNGGQLIFVLIFRLAVP